MGIMYIGIGNNLRVVEILSKSQTYKGLNSWHSNIQINVYYIGNPKLTYQI